MLFPFFSGRTEAQECLTWRGENIPFTIRKGSPRRKRTLIRVIPGGEVEVILPPKASDRDALTALRSRGDWVLTQRRRMQTRPTPQPLRYVSGEKHLFLGEYYPLELVLPSSEATSTKTEDFFSTPVVTGRSQLLRIKVNSDAPETVHKQLFLWYKKQIQKRIEDRLSDMRLYIPWLTTLPPWRVRCMRRRWGSCTGSGIITLNTHLIKAPPQCIDYVLLHELVHLREHNHSTRYYAELEKLFPNWKNLRKELELWAPLILS